MARPSRSIWLVLVQVLLLSQLWFELLAVSHNSIVKVLPGLQGPLPFELETGYVGVGESEEVQLFYYFLKSERNPEEDPLMLWLTGGPGCSAVTALFFEIGPLNFKVEQYNGSLPTLVLNPHSWTKDFPMQELHLLLSQGIWNKCNTPFSSLGSGWLITQVLCQILSISVGIRILEFLSLFLLRKSQMAMKQGYILGNPVTVRPDELNSEIPFAHGMGLISDELYESLTRSCGGDYQNINPRNTECVKNVQAYDKCTSKINFAHILERHCDRLISPKLQHRLAKRRYLNDNYNMLLHSESALPTLGCRSYGYLLSHYWANDPFVRKALHIRKGSIGKWQRCDYEMPYESDIHGNSLQYHVKLSAKGYPSLIYSGDHDMLVPFLATQAWIRSLNYSIIDDWRPWIVRAQIAGYTRTYVNRMTFATVKGAGHTAPEYKGEECLHMFTRWISGEPL